jgi:hypothetical protein
LRLRGRLHDVRARERSVNASPSSRVRDMNALLDSTA